MDRRRVARWAMALALGGAFGSTAMAGAVTFTGNVETDMAQGHNNGVYVIPGVPAGSIGQASWITQSGWVNGWTVKDLRFDYNKTTDTMQVGVNFYSIAGDASGNPAGSDSRVGGSGGYAPANLAGRDSISVEFAGNNPSNVNVPGTPVVVAGVPANKSTAYTGLDGFTVAAAGSNPLIQANYGAQINSAMGNLAFTPTPTTPDFEFTIKNWSQFSALNGKNGFWISGYAGSPDDVVAGETTIPWVHIDPFAQTVVPEPTTLAGWALMVAGAAWAVRRKRQVGLGG